MNKKRVVHISSVHNYKDTRILLKECASLARNGWEVYFLNREATGTETGVNLQKIAFHKSVLVRVLITNWLIFVRALKLKGHIYHFHDPELIIIGLALRIFGKKVIYDVHEDVPRQMLSKDYIPPFIRRILLYLTAFIEKIAAKCLTAVIVVTPHIYRRFETYKPDHLILLQNFPLSHEISNSEIIKPAAERKYNFGYIGLVQEIRGIFEITDALEIVAEEFPVQLHIGGIFRPESLLDELKKKPGWKHVTCYGWVDRAKIQNILSGCIAGLVPFHPVPDHIDAQPNKMFEYMSSGIAVIGSDFPLWREFIEDRDTGYLVDPQSASDIARTMKQIIRDPETAERKGANGSALVSKEWNWENEVGKMIELYSTID